MNILPKKRWHVRTKDNIARVRRDEAKAAEEERVKQDKLNLAESEARINFLRGKQGIPRKTKEDAAQAQSSSSHVDLFSDFKSFQKRGNEEHAKEQKEEKEKYEKEIGYLTYLGQDTNESLKLKSWYEVAPNRNDFEFQSKSSIVEKDLKTKFLNDPLTLIHAVVPPEKFPEIPKKAGNRLGSPPKSKKVKKHKKEHKRKKSKKSKRNAYDEDVTEIKKQKLLNLRKERLKREAMEKERQGKLFAKEEKSSKPDLRIVPQQYNQRYNSQFNPHIAKQNIS
ncbi:LENG1 family protein [Megaselia abdita]